MLKLIIGSSTILVIVIYSISSLVQLENISDVLLLLILRIVGNVDVLDYIENLQLISFNYPFSSIFYSLWPFFQMSQDNFIVPGVWLHGTLYDDWRGYGPNPTFIGDLLIASNYFGIVYAIILAYLLKKFSASQYTVFLSFVIYSFLQDWYMSSLILVVFITIFITFKYLNMFLSDVRSCRVSHDAPVNISKQENS